MITVIRDNTKFLYYTKCKKCKSEFNYEYEDVNFSESPYIQMVFGHVTCPICNYQSCAELQIKEDYSENSFLPNLSTASINTCCCETKVGDDL